MFLRCASRLRSEDSGNQWWERLWTGLLGMGRAWNDVAGAVDREAVSWLSVDGPGSRRNECGRIHGEEHAAGNAVRTLARRVSSIVSCCHGRSPCSER